MVSIIVLFPTFPLLFSIFLVIASGLTPFFPSMVKELGEDFMAGCSDDNYTISWRGPKGPLNSKTKPRVEVVPQVGTMIHFKNPTEKDTGNYTCSTEADSKVVYILIKVPLTFMDTRQVQTVPEFENGTLRCEVKGGINPTISWYVHGAEAKPPKYELLGDGIMIVNVTAKDSGLYTCKATASLTGDVKEKNISLTVEHKPYARDGTVWTNREPAWGYLGSTVNLSCEAIAEPPPKFEWRLPNKTYGKIFNDTYTTILQVDIPDEKVFGNYSCIISNKYGSLNKTFQLERGEQPLPPDFVEQQAENWDLLDIGIQPPNNSKGFMAPIGFVIQYRLVDPKKPHGNPWNEQFFNISNRYILRSLKPNSKYEIRVATKNLAGFSKYTNTSLFFTLESASDSSSLENGTLCNIFLIISVILLSNW